jgi:hypothetical protein
MFICNDCGEYFDEPGAKTETEIFEGRTYSSDYNCCPACGSYDYEKASVCGLCDEPVYETFDYCKYHLDVINAAMDVAVHTIEESADVGKSRDDVIHAIGTWLEER